MDEWESKSQSEIKMAESLFGSSDLNDANPFDYEVEVGDPMKINDLEYSIPIKIIAKANINYYNCLSAFRKYLRELALDTIRLQRSNMENLLSSNIFHPYQNYNSHTSSVPVDWTQSQREKLRIIMNL